jgi:hypothetical protein
MKGCVGATQRLIAYPPPSFSLDMALFPDRYQVDQSPHGRDGHAPLFPCKVPFQRDNGLIF